MAPPWTTQLEWMTDVYNELVAIHDALGNVNPLIDFDLVALFNQVRGQSLGVNLLKTKEQL